MEKNDLDCFYISLALWVLSDWVRLISCNNEFSSCLANFSFSFAQTFQCETIYQGQLVNTTSPKAPSICAKVIDYQIAINPALGCQSSIENSIAPVANIFGLEAFGMTMTDRCQTDILRALCTTSYAKCVPNPLNPEEPSVYPQGCKSACTPQLESCASDFIFQQVKAQLGSLFPELLGLLNCDDTAIWLPNDNPTCNPGPSKASTVEDVPKPKCEPYRGEMCKNTFAGDIYIPTGMSQEVLEALISPFRFVLALANVDNGAANLMQSMMCQRAFMECTTVSYIPVPKLPCRDLCEAYNEANESLFQQDEAFGTLLRLDCDQKTFNSQYGCDGEVLNPEAGLYNYPDGTYQMLGLDIPCSKNANPDTPDILASAVTEVNAICEGHLVIPEDPSSPNVLRANGGSCAVACPVTMFTTEEYQNMDALMLVSSILSFVCGAFLLLTFTLFKVNRNKYVMFMTICVMCVYGGLIINAIRAKALGSPTIAHSFCRTNAEEYHFGNGGYCLFNGLTFTYFLVCAISWWLIQATDLFLKVVILFNPPLGSKEAKLREYCYHGFAWGSPLVFLLPAIAREQIGGFAGGTPWCFYSLGRGDSSALDISTYTFFLPVMVYAVVGCGMMLVVMGKLFLGHIRDKSQANNKQSLCQVYLRLIVFVLFMSYLWIFLFVYKVFSQTRKSSWYQSMEDMYTCTLVTKWITGVTCPDVPEDRIPVGLVYALMLCSCLAGFVLTLISIISKEIFKSWASLFYSKFPCCSCFKRYSRNPNHLTYAGVNSNTAGPGGSGGSAPLSGSAAISVGTSGGSTAAAKKNLFGNSTAARRNMFKTSSVAGTSTNASFGGSYAGGNGSSYGGIEMTDMNNGSSAGSTFSPADMPMYEEPDNVEGVVGGSRAPGNATLSVDVDELYDTNKIPDDLLSDASPSKGSSNQKVYVAETDDSIPDALSNSVSPIPVDKIVNTNDEDEDSDDIPPPPPR